MNPYKNIFEVDQRLKTLFLKIRKFYLISESSNLDVLEHGLTHVGRVISNILLISEEESFSNKSIVSIVAGALCHDIGYYVDSDNHVFSSIELAPQYLIESEITTI